jgi:metal-sulfur cluster biosynthetic enzyme
MDPEMRSKIDAILARVKEPETRRSVGDLNLVKRVRYSPGSGVFEVFMDVANPRGGCLVCGIVTNTIRESIERELKEAFEQDFPGCRVHFS